MLETGLGYLVFAIIFLSIGSYFVYKASRDETKY